MTPFTHQDFETETKHMSTDILNELNSDLQFLKKEKAAYQPLKEMRTGFSSFAEFEESHLKTKAATLTANQLVEKANEYKELLHCIKEDFEIQRKRIERDLNRFKVLIEGDFEGIEQIDLKGLSKKLMEQEEISLLVKN